MRFLVGVDVGSKKIKATAGYLDSNGNIKILGTTSSDSMGIKRGIVVDIENASKAINVCISGLERIIDKDINEVYLSFRDVECETAINKGIVAISSNRGEIEISDVDRVKNAAKVIAVPSNKEVIGLTPLHYIVDGYDNIKDPVGMNGTRLEVEAKVILGNSTVINSLLKSFKNNGLKVIGVVMNSSAIISSILSNSEKKMGSLVIDIGGERTDFYLIKDNKNQYSDFIPVGGSNITNDISICCKISFDEAEKLKIKYANLYTEDEEEIIIKNNLDEEKIKISYLNRIIEARVEEILLMVKEKVKEQSHKVENIVIIGGGIGTIKNIEEFSKEILENNVRIGIPKYVGSASPIFAVSVGIVEDSLVNVKEYNIVNNDELEKRSIIKKIKDMFLDFF